MPGPYSITLPVEPHPGDVVGGMTLLLRTLSQANADNNAIKSNYTLTRGQIRQMHQKAIQLGFNGAPGLLNANVGLPS